jgi:hypothetical protein
MGPAASKLCITRQHGHEPCSPHAVHDQLARAWALQPASCAPPASMGMGPAAPMLCITCKHGQRPCRPHVVHHLHHHSTPDTNVAWITLLAHQAVMNHVVCTRLGMMTWCTNVAGVAQAHPESHSFECWKRTLSKCNAIYMCNSVVCPDRACQHRRCCCDAVQKLSAWERLL